MGKTTGRWWEALKDNAFHHWELEIAIRYLRNRRKDGGVAVIAILSFVGIFLSVTSLITITSAMRGLQAHQMETFFTFKYHVIATFPKGREDRMSAAAPSLKAVDGVLQASAFIERPALLQAPRGVAGAVVFGIAPDAYASRAALQRRMIAGDWAQCPGCAVIGDKLAQEMDIRPGDTLTLTSPQANAVSYRVSGIFRSGDPKADASYVFLPLDDARALFGAGHGADGIGIVLADPYAMTSAVTAIKQKLGGSAEVESWQDTENALWHALNIERVGMQVILSFVVLISALNIVAALTMLVKNKTKDIGILRTMGASRKAVTRIFFLSGMMIGGVATCCGFAFGALVVAFIEPLQRWLDAVFHIRVFGYGDAGGELVYVPATFNLAEALTIFALSLMVSALCTLFPAVSAARLDPVAAVADTHG